MRIWRAIKRAACLVAAIALTAVVVYTPAKEEVTYHVPVEQGDTVYEIASRIATPDEDINRLSWRICKDNGIENPGDLQPGMELIVTVERRK